MYIKVCLILMVTAVIQTNAQIMVSLLQPSDSRIMALGNSLTADNISINSISSNPASLAGFEGVSAFYQKRDFSHLNDDPDHKLQSGTAAIGTPIGAFALRYANYHLITNISDYTFGVTYGVKINEVFSIGITVKIFDYSDGELNNDSKPAVLSDLGILFHTNGFISQNILNNRLSAGVALQNFGTKWKPTTAVIMANEDGSDIQLPLFLRTGFAWHTEIGTNPILFEWQLSAEYRKLLNPDKPGQYYDNARSNYWGIGLELQAYEILILRIGGEIDPHMSDLGEAKRLNLRYGVGLNVSPRQFGSDIPIYLKVDYGIIPFPTFHEITHNKKNLSAWSIGIQYQKILFN